MFKSVHKKKRVVGEKKKEKNPLQLLFSFGKNTLEFSCFFSPPSPKSVTHFELFFSSLSVRGRGDLTTRGP